MAQNDNREKFLRLIRSMQQRTVSNGFTEAEAMQAAEKVGELMDRYAFTADDINHPEGPQENVTEHTYFDPKRQLLGLTSAASAIAAFCDCKAFTRKHSNGKTTLHYFGRETDIQVADYMTHLVANAMGGAWEDFRKTRPTGEKLTHQRRDFERMFATRVAQRLYEMKRARNVYVDPTTNRSGNQLVVIKNAVVDSAYAKAYPHMRNAKAAKTRGTSAMEAGRAAGDRVQFHAGIRGGEQKRIS
jgi:hypothetical protein